MGVDCFGGGAGRRRGAPLGAVFLPDTAELINVDMARGRGEARVVTEASGL